MIFFQLQNLFEMARTKAFIRQPGVVAAPTNYPTSSFQSPASVVKSALNAESPRVERIQREFGSGLITNFGEADEEDDDNEGDEDEGGKEDDELAIEDEELDLVDADQIGDKAQRSGFWQPLVQVADVDQLSTASSASPTHHINHLIAFEKSGGDSELKKRLDILKQLREVTKESMTKTQDPEVLAALEAEDLELLLDHRKILKKMLAMSATEDD